MQRIEFCRHRAEIAEARAAICTSSEELRAELTDLAAMWRELAHEYEEQDRFSDGSAGRP